MPAKRNKIPVKERFWEKVSPLSVDECWEWERGLTSHGYGLIWDGMKQEKAHRVSWELHNGPIPDGLHVLHKCDNRKCVNPNHLWIGTNAQNTADMVAKGRAAKGEKSGKAILDEICVTLIREIYANGKTTHLALAKFFGVGESTIANIVKRNSWRHI